MVDREVVARRLRELDRRVAALQSIVAAHDRAAYGTDFALQAQVERHLQLAVQCAIDTATHIAAQDTAAVPEDYGDTFVILAREGVLDGELADRLRAAAGLRNVLVHGYVAIDHDLVWGSLARLDDLRRFAAAVVAYVDAAPPAEAARPDVPRR